MTIDVGMLTRADIRCMAMQQLNEQIKRTRVDDNISTHSHA